MKELQKYYFEYVAGDFDGYEKPFYLASEAEAAFAEMRREHAEDIERLKAALKHYAEPKNCEQFWIDEYYRYRKQAERYEKLRKLNARQVYNLSLVHLGNEHSFDALVDQLPASGEAQK